jgi:Concanavalin A-like lectin/glucanases superfamily
MGWQFQFWDGNAWVNFANAQVDHILEELSGQEECVFTLPNTATTRAIVQSLPFIQVLYSNTTIFPTGNGQAVIAGLQYSPTTITVTAYNYIFVQLSQASQTINKNYVNVAASSILAQICVEAGVQAGTCPTFQVSVKFNNANCLKAAQELAKDCGCDYWADSNGFNIGTRDSTIQTLGWVGTGSKRGLDYSKQVDQVIISGVDASGVAIKGSAGIIGGSIAAFTAKKAADVSTLNQLAAFKLQTLNNPSNGNGLVCLTDQVYSWHPGQYVNANREDLCLQGSFIIHRITKNAVTATVEPDAAMPQMDILLQETDQYADLGTYTMQPSMLTPSALSLQGLFGLYHVTEMQGSKVLDSNPNSNGPNDGVVTGGTWINGVIAGTKVLQLTQGQIDCGSGFNVGGSSAFTVGMWFSPYDASRGFLIGQAGQYCIQLGANKTISFQVQTSSLATCTSPDNSVVENGRIFVIAVYDGSAICLYVNGALASKADQSGVVAAGNGDVLVGVIPFSGVVAEIMFWTRALSAQEVQELYYQPLVRVGSSILGQVPLPPPIDDGQFGYVIMDIEDGYLGAVEDLLVADRILLDRYFSRSEDLPYINWGLFEETALNRLEDCLLCDPHRLDEIVSRLEAVVIYYANLGAEESVRRQEIFLFSMGCCLDESVSLAEAVIVHNP